MADLEAKNLGEPDEVVNMPGVELNMVDLGDLTVARAVHQPGWRWSTHIQPRVGGDWCQVHHVGMVLSGRIGILLSNGSSYEFGEDDVYDIPPGHDGYTIGHEPCVMLEWTGIRAFAGFMGGAQNRMLATVLVARFANSAERAREVGTAAWRDLSSNLFEAIRARYERFNGQEIHTTGEGTLAAFNSPAQAVQCAGELQKTASKSGLRLRAGVQIGEVELVGNDMRGPVLHETERILAHAEDNEILVSDTVRLLTATSGLAFESRGMRTIEGLESQVQLHAYSSAGDPESP